MTRISEGYEPRFDIDNAYGNEGERYVADVIDGMKQGRVEVKRDAMFQKTGNLYVEYECLRNDGWNKSGIATTEADVWVFVLGDSGVCFAIPTEKLKALARERFRKGDIAEERDGSHPTKGVLISFAGLLKAAMQSY